LALTNGNENRLEPDCHYAQYRQYPGKERTQMNWRNSAPEVKEKIESQSLYVDLHYSGNSCSETITKEKSNVI
jgi:hypothetical protein